MFNPRIILSYLGASVIADMIKSITFGFAGDLPHFFSSMFTAIGWYVVLHIYVNKLEDQEGK